MKEMENIPRDSNKKSNILVDDDEMEKNKNNIENISQNYMNPQDSKLTVQTKENPVEENDYLSQMFHKNFSINIIILLSLIILIMLEYIYRRPLFTYSLTYEQNIQSSLSKNGFELYKLISILGGGVFIGIGLVFVLCYYSLVKTIVFCIGIIFIVYVHDIMKLMYGDPRPFWINSILFQGNCETSYGNPSGHSLAAFFFFLSFSYYLTIFEKIRNNLTYKIIVYLTGIFLACLTAYSRLALGVHSLDQVLYGSALGIWFFVIFAYVFKIYNMPLSYYLKFYRNRKYFNIAIITLLTLFILPIILYYLVDAEEDFKKYDLVMSKKCPNIEKYKFYNHNCMWESLIILLICGMYLGQYLFWYLINSYNTNENNKHVIENNINYWNDYIKEIFSSFGNLIKAFALLIITLLPGILYFVVPGENNSLRNIFIFKIGLPLFLIGFLAFGPCFYGFIYILKEQKSSFSKLSEEH